MSADKFDPKEADITESDYSGGGSDSGEGERDFDRGRPGRTYGKKHLFTTTISVSSSSRELRAR